MGSMALVIKKGMTRKQIDALWEKVTARRQKRKPRPVPDIWQFCGVIKLKEDPRVIQQRLRDEWS